MKTRIVCFVTVLLMSSHIFAEPSLREAVNRYIAMFEQSRNNRKPVVYPELAQRVERLFLRYPAIHINISGFSNEGRKRSTDIYIKGEEVYVIDAADGWNLAATSAGWFEWEKDHKNGIKITRNDDDLVAYLYYLTDPSWIMASLYSEYLTSPDKFTAVANKDNNWTELRLKAPRYGFEAIYVSENPLWFHGMRVRINGEVGPVEELIISEPQKLKVLPESLTQQLKRMNFEDSNLTLQRHMTFL